MEEADYLIEELKRLNRVNDFLEKKMKQEIVIQKEPEQIENNVLAMCEIVKTIKVE